MGSWSYLAVGLLFGLTLPGVSAHGFLRGGGWGKGLYSSKNHTRHPQRERERERRGQKRPIKVDRNKEERSETIQREDETERRRWKQTDKTDRDRSSVGGREQK